MVRFAIFSAILALISFCNGHAESEYDPYPIYRTGLRHIESGGVGYRNGYTTLDMFVLGMPTEWCLTPFLDVRGHYFNSGNWAANTGIGLRALNENGVYGINLFYDYRNVGRFNVNQVGIGLEKLGEQFDFRINGYLPIGKKISHSFDASFGGFSGHHLLVSQKYHSAMSGANAELGFRLGEAKSIDFYVAAGPYYFQGEATRSTWGAKARVSGLINDFFSLEISDSFDRTFHNKFQAEISFPFGPKSKDQRCTCKMSNPKNRMLQRVERQEIIVVDNPRKDKFAIDPVTGQPYYFVFVDNTSSSRGTYESPYHSLIQAQENSSPNDIIYVFPGDGTIRGMDSGIALKANQRFWGSGIGHQLATTKGMISIPAQTDSSPIITNTNLDTEGNAITLSSNNAISGFVIASALNDAIYGTDPQSLEVSYCLFENTNTYAIEASFPGSATISVTNNQFINNVNGLFFGLNGSSTLVCSNNVFKDQTSVSSFPIEVSANNNSLSAKIENNTFNNNTTGSIRFGLNNVFDANVSVLNNTFTNNGTGSQSSLGSNLVVLTTGITDNCSILLKNNLFSGNASNSLYMHTSGAFSTLKITASSNNMSNNGGSGLVVATPVDALTFLASDNIIANCNDNGIAVISSSSSSLGNITIKNNTITDIGNASNGIAINQDFTALNLNILNNKIERCEGTGIISYAPSGIGSLTLNVSGNTITHCQNLSSNSASGLDIEQYTNLEGFISENTFTDDAGIAVVVGSTLSSPTACLTLTGNESSSDYLLTNPVDGLFNLSPCDADSSNSGIVNTSGEITPVQSCPEAASCPL